MNSWQVQTDSILSTNLLFLHEPVIHSTPDPRNVLPRKPPPELGQFLSPDALHMRPDFHGLRRRRSLRVFHFLSLREMPEYYELVGNAIMIETIA